MSMPAMLAKKAPELVRTIRVRLPKFPLVDVRYLDTVELLCDRYRLSHAILFVPTGTKDPLLESFYQKEIKEKRTALGEDEPKTSKEVESHIGVHHLPLHTLRILGIPVLDILLLKLSGAEDSLNNLSKVIATVIETLPDFAFSRIRAYELVRVMKFIGLLSKEATASIKLPGRFSDFNRDELLLVGSEINDLREFLEKEQQIMPLVTLN